MELCGGGYKRGGCMSEPDWAEKRWTRGESLFTLFASLTYGCERFEPRSHFKSRLSLIVRVTSDLI